MSLVGVAIDEVAIEEVGLADRGRELVARPTARWKGIGASALSVRLRLGDLCWSVIAWAAVASRMNGSLRAEMAAVAVAVLLTMLMLEALGLYKARVCVNRTQERVRLLLVSGTAAWGFIAVDTLLRQTSLSAGLTVGLAAWALCSVALWFHRWYFSRWLQVQRATGRFLRPVVVVGGSEDASRLVVMLQSEPSLGYRVTGVVGPDLPTDELGDLLACEGLENVPSIARATGATGIMVAQSHLPNREVSRVVHEAIIARLHVQIWAGLEGVGIRRLRSTPVSGEAVFYVEPAHYFGWRVFAKRAVDVVASATGLALCSPLLLLAALLVKLEDGGPALFRQERIGKDGIPFEVLKLRSMTTDASKRLGEVASLNQRTGPLFKAESDPRVTRIGRLIRPTSIDELPQLINVLRGDMSLVGPRPALPHESVTFDSELRRRESVKPGLTGLWQLEGRENPSFHAYRRLDLHYVDNWSLGMDLAILLNTLPTVFGQALRSVRRKRVSKLAEPVVLEL